MPRHGFVTTRWTVVRACAQSDERGHEARTMLVGLGNPGIDAEDLTQAFFAHILRRPWFA